MRIGITGGMGFIGSAVGRLAKARGHEVVVYSRKCSSSPPPWAVECRTLDPEKTPVLDPGGLDALVHLAGESVMGYWTAAKKKRIWDSRVPLTQKVVASLREATHPPGVFVCASGTGAYGNRGDEILTEFSARGEGFLADVCAGWEAAAEEAGEFGVRVVTLRTGMVLGEGGGAWPLLKRVFGMRLGSRLGSGAQWVPWIHLDDEAGLILHAIENPDCRGPLNLASPHPVTNAEMTRQIAKALHSTTFVPAPAFAMKLVLGDFASVVLESSRVKPQKALDTGYDFKYTDFGQALQALVQQA